MKNLILILAVLFLFWLGFHIVKEVDDFIENGGFRTNKDEK